MLDFIYTGSINNTVIENFAQSVLAIADKYALFPLKEYCEKYLASIINQKNVASIAIIADMYFASYLKKVIVIFEYLIFFIIFLGLYSFYFCTSQKGYL